MEHRLDQIENTYSQVLRRLHRRERITLLDKAKLAIFTAAMRGRSVRQGDHWKNSWESLREQVSDSEGGGVPSMGSGTLQPDEPLPQGAVRVSKQMLDDMLVNSHPEHLVNTIQFSSPILFAMDMSLYSTDDELGFLTSDEPCITYNRTAYRYHPMLRSPGLLQRDVQILLPLSPRLLVAFTHTPTFPQITPLTREQTNDINRLIVHYGRDEFLSWKGEVREEWFASSATMPEDAYREEPLGIGNEGEMLEQPELIDVSRYPADHPFRVALPDLSRATLS